MGLKYISSCECGNSSTKEKFSNFTKSISNVVKRVKRASSILVEDSNPDPKNFIIEKRRDIGRYTILQVRYPDCKNYEGLKILFFENIFDIPDQEIDFLDPHFCKGSHLSPMARFEPTEDGINTAILLAHTLAKKDAKVQQLSKK